MKEIDLVGPQLAVLLAAAAIIVIEALMPSRRRMLPYVALVGLLASVLWTTSWVRRDELQTAFDGTLAFDEYAVFFYYLFAGITATVVLASVDWVEREGRGQAEYYALVLVTCSGLMFLAAARDLITIFIALELSSIPQYILAGWGKDQRSSEAGLKYLLLGAIASSLLLYRVDAAQRNRQSDPRRRRDEPLGAGPGDGAPDHRLRVQDGRRALPDVGA
jgi:NADH-quinone oxidoreductase subunit N